MAIIEGDTAILVIDVQKRFCDPNGPLVDVGNGPEILGDAKTDAVSRRIQSQVSEFRKIGIPVYVIYCENNGKEIDFHEFMPAANDVLVAKNLNNANSAFISSNIETILKRDGRKSLLACGFFLSNCLGEAILDAHNAGFSITLLHDLSDGNYNDKSPVCNKLRERQQKGVTIEHSDTVLKHLRAQQNTITPTISRPSPPPVHPSPSPPIA